MKQIIYVVTATNREIEVWELYYTGKMILIQIINTDNKEGQPITILKKRKKLYIGIRPNYQILVYDILFNGTLKKIGKINIPYSPNYLSTDKNEKFLFCSYYHAGCLSVSYINNNHIPSQPIQIFNNLKGCHSVHVDTSNTLVLTLALLDDRIYIFNLNNNNLKSPLKMINYAICKKKSGPRHFIYHNNKKYCYSINELNGTIDVWKINNIKKNIKNIQNIDLFYKNNNNKFWSSDIQITSCNNYLYASDRIYNTISVFKINTQKKLNFMYKIYTTKQPKSFIIDYNNKYLISVGQKSNTMIVYSISMANGYLNKMYEYKVGKNPTWITNYKI
ncbi:beta-propeller fold lactonase family protein [Buchnera aphidicola]|uniref:6-phosphogluconolactonase n=1 Tax=Buchnera aphidicola (Therioaphis trifolii) TaxID=1241884 RepID=A0A4D6YMY1_9GAMM|nr:beta-propeller fold lactonase family protein [Buchnera aphidicola]QCI27198.1 6-phosphogluconolactonase [Buchnera aphidicola (Therioaphis trifolii)]